MNDRAKAIIMLCYQRKLSGIPMHCACSCNPDKSFPVIRNHSCLSGSSSENAGMALSSIGLLMELAKVLSCGICGIGMSENPAEVGTVVGMAALLLGSEVRWGVAVGFTVGLGVAVGFTVGLGVAVGFAVGFGVTREVGGLVMMVLLLCVGAATEPCEECETDWCELCDSCEECEPCELPCELEPCEPCELCELWDRWPAKASSA